MAKHLVCTAFLTLLFLGSCKIPQASLRDDASGLKDQPANAKVSVIILSFENPVYGEKYILDDIQNRIKKFQNCGVDVKHISQYQSLNTLKENLVQAMPASVVWIDAHGDHSKFGRLESSLNSSASIRPDESKLSYKLPQDDHVIIKKGAPNARMEIVAPTADILQTIRDASAQKQNFVPQIILDTCQSGACADCKGLKVLAACSIGGESYSAGPFAQSMSDLMCSATSDCKLWSQIDQNGDGVIQSPELSEYWLSKSEYKELKSEESIFFEDDLVARQKFTKDCQAQRGKPETMPNNSSYFSVPISVAEKGTRLCDLENKLNSMFPEVINSSNRDIVNALENAQNSLRTVCWQDADASKSKAILGALSRELAGKIPFEVGEITKFTLVQMNCKDMNEINMAPEDKKPLGARQKPVIKGFELAMPQCRKSATSK